MNTLPGPDAMNGPVLVTGTAGFIGYHVAERLLLAGYDVVGIDIVNDYYDVTLKEARLLRLASHDRWRFHRIDLADSDVVRQVFAETQPEIVIHLAAQAGVRHSLSQPGEYIESNIVGFLHILEGCRHNGVKHLLYASSSSVYGWNTAMPFSEQHGVDHPISLYAATKKSNEAMAHAYAALFDLPCTGLRFFTVYGPWGRPDMALFIFTRKMLAGQPIDVYNHGNMGRDFTFVDDVTEGIQRLMHHPAAPDPSWDSSAPDTATSRAPWRVYNIGNNAPVALMDMIGIIESKLGIDAVKNFMPLQPGDVPRSWADSKGLMAAVGYKPDTSLEVGIGRFIDWYREYYG
jgi:UDP-glucuronate 4-epimerase